MPLLKPRVGRDPWVTIEACDEGDFDDTGIGKKEQSGYWLQWSDVVRVACAYEIHPVAIADWDFWAFQTRNPAVTYWLYSSMWPAMEHEVRRRYLSCDVPPMASWADREFCVRAYVVWPPSDTGGPLYDTVKRHIWSFSGRLAYHFSTLNEEPAG